ncbi:hypothetical protein A1O7_00836 [Cladophialophora yegresii CBS 114405]|uniref:Transcription factor domain-containing protein n=1 Tax=Cladophialophora yegresii CBS 114405 TaxID=1182544 RepID=W9WHP6_9EURO|nr:uncharacterized protein A1O7_00836 [Cladophialophora yegresii CBS 114405]EXJ64500.1 hypothetical protein A1O7_00836 [Cladophialophora yegresii CBS 114405]
MSKNQKPTVYLFINKDSASPSLSRSHGKDASAILSHVQSCRNQKNKRLHMFRVDDGVPEPPAKRPSSRTPRLSPQSIVSSRQSSPRPPPSPGAETSSSSSPSVSASPLSSVGSASPRPHRTETPDVDELVDYFDTVSLTSDHQPGTHLHRHDLYQQIVSSEDFRNFSRRIAGDVNGYAMLACTAARMAVDIPSRREEFEIKATRYMQPSLRWLREQLADPQARILRDRQILQEMLLHCVTNWYLGDLVAAQTHLKAMSCFTASLDLSRSSDQNLMDIIDRCGLYITNQRRAEHLPYRCAE